MRTDFSFLLLIALFLITGCVQRFSFASTNVNHVAKVIVNAKEIKIYRTSKPKKPFKEIGIAQVNGPFKLEVHIRKIKELASLNGGNAIVDLKIQSNGIIGTVIQIDN